MINNGLIQNLNTSPATLQLYVVGSTSINTTVTIGNNGSSGAGTTLFVYAPNSAASLANNVYVTGSVIAKSITFGNNARIVYDPSVKSLAERKHRPDLHAGDLQGVCEPADRSGTRLRLLTAASVADAARGTGRAARRVGPASDALRAAQKGRELLEVCAGPPPPRASSPPARGPCAA